MQDKRIDGEHTITFDQVGFHEASFDVQAMAIEQYESVSGLPVYRALLTDKEVRMANKELCGITTCQCGAALDVIDREGSHLWINVNPDMLSSDDWDELMDRNC